MIRVVDYTEDTAQTVAVFLKESAFGSWAYKFGYLHKDESRAELPSHGVMCLYLDTRDALHEDDERAWELFGGHKKADPEGTEIMWLECVAEEILFNTDFRYHRLWLEVI